MNAIFNVVVRETSGPGCLLHFFFFFFFSLIKKFFLIVFKILVALVFLEVLHVVFLLGAVSCLPPRLHPRFPSR